MGMSTRRINSLCNGGRIKGAIKFGNVWTLPEGAEQPKDERIRSGRYVKIIRYQ